MTVGDEHYTYSHRAVPITLVVSLTLCNLLTQTRELCLHYYVFYVMPNNVRPFYLARYTCYGRIILAAGNAVSNLGPRVPRELQNFLLVLYDAAFIVW